jgi:hypothetical protein
MSIYIHIKKITNYMDKHKKKVFKKYIVLFKKKKDEDNYNTKLEGGVSIYDIYKTNDPRIPSKYGVNETAERTGE